MTDRYKSIRRHDLYRQVWQTPMSELAKQYNISDVGLAKICRKHNIPRPPRGYWARKSSGVKVEKTPLPKKKQNDLITIRPNRNYGVAKNDTESIKAYLPEKDIGPVIVPARLSNPHPLIEKTYTLLKKARPNDKGLLVSRANNYLDIRVSEKLLPRAVRIMNALVKAMIDLEFNVYIASGETVVNIEGIELKFGIREKLKIEKTLRDPNEFLYEFRPSDYHHTFVPSGNLCLSVHNFYSSCSLQRNWQDNQKQKLEDILEKVIKGFVKLSIAKKEEQRKREEEKRLRQEMIAKQEEERRRLEELQKMIHLEQKRVSQLIETAENWQKSKLIREFVSAVEQKRKSGECSYQPDCDWHEWFTWAREQADRLDPLTPSPPSIIDEWDDIN